MHGRCQQRRTRQPRHDGRESQRSHCSRHSVERRGSHGRIRLLVAGLSVRPCWTAVLLPSGASSAPPCASPAHRRRGQGATQRRPTMERGGGRKEETGEDRGASSSRRADTRRNSKRDKADAHRTELWPKLCLKLSLLQQRTARTGQRTHSIVKEIYRFIRYPADKHVRTRSGRRLVERDFSIDLARRKRPCSLTPAECSALLVVLPPALLSIRAPASPLHLPRVHRRSGKQIQPALRTPARTKRRWTTTKETEE